MAIKGLGKVVKRLQRMQKVGKTQKMLRVGFLEGATYPDGTPVALVAAVQEFGSPVNHIPARPFMRTAIEQNQGKWAAHIAKVLPQVESADDALNLAGEVVEDDLRKSIRDGGWAPNAPGTVAQKGFGTPLIDTAHMVRSISHDLTEES